MTRYLCLLEKTGPANLKEDQEFLNTETCLVSVTCDTEDENLKYLQERSAEPSPRKNTTEFSRKKERGCTRPYGFRINKPCSWRK